MRRRAGPAHALGGCGHHRHPGAVFPANVQMALDSGTGRNHGPSDRRAVAWGRLPLQLVMAWAALQARQRPA